MDNYQPTVPKPEVKLEKGERYLKNSLNPTESRETGKRKLKHSK